jgi:hypothetical protein
MEPSSLHQRPSPSCIDHLARRGSEADRNEPAPSGLRSTHHLLQSLPAAFEALLQYLELVELVREAVLDEVNAPSTHVSARRSCVWPICFRELPLRLLPRSDVTSAFVLLLRNGMVDMCMIGRDGVVNSNDLHAAMAQSATLRIAIDLHHSVSTRYAE